VASWSFAGGRTPSSNLRRIGQILGVACRRRNPSDVVHLYIESGLEAQLTLTTAHRVASFFIHLPLPLAFPLIVQLLPLAHRELHLDQSILQIQFGRNHG